MQRTIIKLSSLKPNIQLIEVFTFHIDFSFIEEFFTGETDLECITDLFTSFPDVVLLADRKAKNKDLPVTGFMSGKQIHGDVLLCSMVKRDGLFYLHGLEEKEKHTLISVLSSYLSENK